MRRRTAQLVKDLSLVSGLKPGKEFLNGFTGKWPKFKSTRVTGSRKFDACKKFGLLKQVMNKSRPAKFQGPAKFMGLAKATCIKNPAQDLLQLLEQNRTISRNRLSSRNENLGLPQLLAAVRTTRAQLEAIPPGRLTQVEQFYIHFLLSRVDIRTIQEFEQILTNHALNRLISWLDLAKEMCQSTNSRVNTRGKCDPGERGRSSRRPCNRGHHTRRGYSRLTKCLLRCVATHLASLRRPKTPCRKGIRKI